MNEHDREKENGIAGMNTVPGINEVDTPENADPHTCGFVAVVGYPNAGKSTLINRFFERKVSIVSPKPQTTRANVTCILSETGFQAIFIDTPGILKPRYRMQEVMRSYIDKALSDADVLLVLVDAAKFNGEYPEPFVKFARSISGRNIVVALNKIDIVKKAKLLEIIAATSSLFPDAEIIPVSALTGDGVPELLEIIRGHLPEGPKLYPDDIISYEPERFFAAELIRESVFLAMEQEIPYATGIVIDSFKDREDGLAVIHATILVERKSQKPILIGKGGRTIKKIGTGARKAIEEFLGRKTYLDLHVKIRDDWRNKDSSLREIGLIRE